MRYDARMDDALTLYYVHDPMCSWCWGFRPTWDRVVDECPRSVTIKYLLGGLAPDTDAPMPENMRQSIRNTWQRIQSEIPGTRFNFDFWEQCLPRRSTYPACRAVIAARQQDSSAGLQMVHAIQEAYYLHARNPSDTEVLVDLAGQLRLDIELFAHSLQSDTTQHTLLLEFAERDRLGAHSFPSLYLESSSGVQAVPVDYHRAETLLAYLQRQSK